MLILLECDGVGVAAHGVCFFLSPAAKMGGHTDFTDDTDFFRLRRNGECHTENTENTESFACGKKDMLEKRPYPSCEGYGR